MPRRKAPSLRDLEFVQWYTSPASPTYDNAVQSAIRAGFAESYAKSNAHKRLVPLAKSMVVNKKAEQTDKAIDRGEYYSKLLRQAEKNIESDLSIPDDADEKKLSLRQKTTHFTAERVGRDVWSTKQIVENSGLFTLTPDTLASLSNALQGNTQPAPPIIEADYTVKLEETDAKRTDQGA